MIEFWRISAAIFLALFSKCWTRQLFSAPEEFTAEISGMPCSLSLMTIAGKLLVKKSSIQCITDQVVSVPSVVVINDNTEHVFKLELKANKRKTRLLSGALQPTPKDVNLATKSIQHQGPEDNPIDLEKVVERRQDPKKINSIAGDCTYEDPKDVDWTPCKATGIRAKTLRLVTESDPGGCLGFLSMSDKCEGGSRGYKQNTILTRNVPVTSIEPDKKKKTEDSGIAAGGYKISVPTEALENRGIDDRDLQSFSSGTLVEGDIMVDSKDPTDRNALLGDSYKWPNNELTYELDSTVSTDQKNLINTAVGLLQSELAQCIKFKQVTSGERVRVKATPNGCWSYVGYHNGVQDLNLASGCYANGVIQHEFLHAIGLFHEQSRSDRDSHINIHLENVRGGTEHNFNKYNVDQVSHYGLGYDYLSVLHYSRKAFSTNGRDTITATNSHFTDKIGQRVGVSLGDVQLVQRHYGCPVVIQWKGKWGSFGTKATFCPSGSFVYGYRVRSEAPIGSGDDTALNDIELYCRRPNSNTVTRKIWSDYLWWGSWSSDTYCSGTDNPVVGFDVKEEGAQGGGDDTALNEVDLYCKNGGYVSASVNTNWGRWKPVQRCPDGFAVMGIRTQVEPRQGSGDDTAMNGVELYCQQYP